MPKLFLDSKLGVKLLLKVFSKHQFHQQNQGQKVQEETQCKIKNLKKNLSEFGKKTLNESSKHNINGETNYLN